MSHEIEQLRRLPRESAREYALRFLKHNVVQVRLEPGTMVSVEEMAQLMGVSRTPVREAMQELEKVGMLEIYPQSGVRVSYIDYDKIHESRFIRLNLETGVIEEACERFRPEDGHIFEENLHAQEWCRRQGDNGRLMELDNLFHRQIYILADKMMTCQVMESYRWHFDRVRRLVLGALDTIGLINDHHAIYKTLRERDKHAAKQALIAHFSRYLDDRKVVRAKFPGYFND